MNQLLFEREIERLLRLLHDDELPQDRPHLMVRLRKMQHGYRVSADPKLQETMH